MLRINGTRRYADELQVVFVADGNAARRRAQGHAEQHGDVVR